MNAMNITRRTFLQLSGVTLATTQLGWGFPNQPSLEAIRGRALGIVPVFEQPNTDTPILRKLWADSIHFIQGSKHKDWVEVADGYVLLRDMQPMMLPDEDKAIFRGEIPDFVEVIAPFTPIRQYCAANAPLIARVGHGGVLPIFHHLVDDKSNLWLQTENGWLQVNHVQKIDIESLSNPEIHVIAKQNQLEIYNQKTKLIQLSCNLPSTLPRQASVTALKPCCTLEANDVIRQGVPWQIELNHGEVVLTGVYWHHDFKQVALPQHIELSVIGAKMLFKLINKETLFFFKM